MDPDGLQYSLNDIYDRYEVPVMAVENGLGAIDTLEGGRSIHGPYRTDCLCKHIRTIYAALKDSIDLRGHTPWGCIDLISASTNEMKKRYRFTYVDLGNEGNGTKNRYKKDSFYWYKKVITSNSENLE